MLIDLGPHVAAVNNGQELEMSQAKSQHTVYISESGKDIWISHTSTHTNLSIICLYIHMCKYVVK